MKTAERSFLVDLLTKRKEIIRRIGAYTEAHSEAERRLSRAYEDLRELDIEIERLKMRGELPDDPREPFSEADDSWSLLDEGHEAQRRDH